MQYRLINATQPAVHLTVDELKVGEHYRVVDNVYYEQGLIFRIIPEHKHTPDICGIVVYHPHNRMWYLLSRKTARQYQTKFEHVPHGAVEYTW